MYKTVVNANEGDLPLFLFHGDSVLKTDWFSIHNLYDSVLRRGFLQWMVKKKKTYLLRSSYTYYVKMVVVSLCRQRIDSLSFLLLLGFSYIIILSYYDNLTIPLYLLYLNLQENVYTKWTWSTKSNYENNREVPKLRSK